MLFFDREKVPIRYLNQTSVFICIMPVHRERREKEDLLDVFSMEDQEHKAVETFVILNNIDASQSEAE